MQKSLIEKMKDDIGVYNILYGDSGKQKYIDRLVCKYNLLQRYKEKYATVLQSVKEKLNLIRCMK